MGKPWLHGCPWGLLGATASAQPGPGAGRGPLRGLSPGRPGGPGTDGAGAALPRRAALALKAPSVGFPAILHPPPLRWDPGLGTMSSPSRWRSPVPGHVPPAFHMKMGGDGQTDVHQAGLAGQWGPEAMSSPGAWRGPWTNSLCWALLPPAASLPQPCPSSIQKNDTCFPLLHTSPSSEATGWDCSAGWTVSGLVSVRRAPHFEQGPHPNTVQGRAHAILLPFTYPSLKTVQEALLFLLPEHSSPDRCLTPNLLRVSV